MEGTESKRRKSDYQQFSEYQRRYSAAKKEARLLRRGANRGAVEGIGPDHPWVEASLRAKAPSASPPLDRRLEQRSRRFRAWPLGLSLLLALLSLALWAPWRPLPTEAPFEAPRLEVWHDLQPGELKELAEVAASLSRQEVRFELVYRPNLSDALRTGAVLGEVPAIAIVEYETAQSLAGAGMLAPLSNGDEYFVPLAAPAPWSRPLTAIAFHSRRDERSTEFIREFTHLLAAKRASDA